MWKRFLDWLYLKRHGVTREYAAHRKYEQEIARKLHELESYNYAPFFKK